MQLITVGDLGQDGSLPRVRKNGFEVHRGTNTRASSTWVKVVSWLVDTGYSCSRDSGDD